MAATQAGYIPESKHVVVIGAGVVGLTTAVKILEKGGYDVTIIAETFPTDPKTIRYTSLWAGAHHVSHAEGDSKQEKIDSDTFDVMWKLSEPGGEAEGCFLRIPQTDYYYDGRDTHLNWMPDFQRLPEDSLIPNAKIGVSFTTLTIDTPVYLNYLLSRFLSKGGRIVKASIQHISQIAEGGANVFSQSLARKTSVDALVVCPGLGARTLGGVEDKDVYPVRGQVVLLRAPWVRFGRTSSHLAQGLWTYIIPRRCGDVIVGGTKAENDWYPVARPETTLDILKRGLELCPELAPPEIRAQRQPTVDDLLPIVLEEGCGFRPARKGGIRLDVDWIEGAKGKIPVVFNYGHAGAGYQSSWGSANIAIELLEKSLSEKK
ncbi:D-amino-acid oxidase [Panus rudis PR-1116 ss-1]|nr:D-amino-acid oxidase [Panus rudis PR-1116 ss-1]